MQDKHVLPLAIALDICGGPTGLARKMAEVAESKVLPQTVSAWMTRGKGRVPAEHCPDIQLATGGKVTCQSLRSDVKWWVVGKVVEHPSDAANDQRNASAP